MYITGQNEVLRVGWVAGPETLGRQGILLSSWAAELARQGVQACIFCPPDSGPGVKGIEEVHHYTQPHWLTLGPNKKSRNLLEVVRNVEVDVLHALDESAAMLTAATGERLGKPYFINCYRLGTRIHLPHKARNLAGVLSASDTIREYLGKRHIAVEDKMYLQRPGVLMEAEPKALEFQDRRAMVLADVYDTHNGEMDAILRSFADVRCLDGGALFFLLHSIRQERSLRRKAEALGLLADITFVAEDDGGRSMHVIQSADVFIAASQRKEFDWGALLAMAAGVPVLARSAEESDFINDGMTASVFSPNRSEELTNLLTNVLTSPEWARAQARSALQYLRVYHNLLRATTGLTKLYRSACQPEEVPVTVSAEAETSK